MRRNNLHDTFRRVQIATIEVIGRDQHAARADVWYLSSALGSIAGMVTTDHDPDLAAATGAAEAGKLHHAIDCVAALMCAIKPGWDFKNFPYWMIQETASDKERDRKLFRAMHEIALLLNDHHRTSANVNYSASRAMALVFSACGDQLIDILIAFDEEYRQTETIWQERRTENMDAI